MGQRPTPFTPSFIPEIQILTESHPDDTAANFLFGNKKPRIRGLARQYGYSRHPQLPEWRVFYTHGKLRQSTAFVGEIDPGKQSEVTEPTIAVTRLARYLMLEGET